MEGQISVAQCPLTTCAWESDPLRSEIQAHEAARSHLAGHSHADLIEHAAQGVAIRVYLMVAVAK